MKKIVCLLMCLCLSSMVFAREGDTMYVFVERSSLKAGKMFWSSKIADVYYGEKVIVIEEDGKWMRVSRSSDPSTKGWIPSSSLTSKKIVSSSDRVSASTDEIALAGKGYTAEVEARYRKEGVHNYVAVDAVEKKTVSTQELYDFIIEGNLEGVD